MSNPPNQSLSLSWHVPGPSSRYHKRTYSAAPPTTPSSATKNNRYTSTPDASLSRSQSSFSYRGSPFSVSSPLLSRSLERANSVPMDSERGPLTPVRSPPGGIHDSPYSDYFTDESRSVDGGSAGKALYSMPSPETQRLLLRLNNVGAQILRQDGISRTTESIGQKLDALEEVIANGENRRSSIGQMQHMIDSGLYMEEDENDTPQPTRTHAPSSSVFSLDGAIDGALDKATYVQTIRKSKDQERLLKEAQIVLERITKANTDLRKRFDEMKDLNDQFAYQVEESSREALMLKSENESLKSDLAFDHSELLFLKLQLKSLEVQADGYMDGQDHSDGEEQKRVLLEEDIQRCKADCDDIDARLRGRRTVHRVMSYTPTKAILRREDGKEADDEGDWKLDMRSKKRQGRVQSITIRRLDLLGLDGARDEDERTDQEDAEEGDAAENNLIKDQATNEIEQLTAPSYIERSTQTECEANTDLPTLAMVNVATMAETEPIHEKTDSAELAIVNVATMVETEPTAQKTDRISNYKSVAVQCTDDTHGRMSEVEEDTDDLPSPHHKSAWQRLWEELDAYAGMGDR